GAALEPFNSAQIDAEIVLQDSPHPDAGRLAVFLNANSLTLKVTGFFDAGVLVYENIAVPEHTRREDGNRHEWKFAARARNHVVGERHLRDVERAGLDHAGE